MVVLPLEVEDLPAKWLFVVNGVGKIDDEEFFLVVLIDVICHCLDVVTIHRLPRRAGWKAHGINSGRDRRQV